MATLTVEGREYKLRGEYAVHRDGACVGKWLVYQFGDGPDYVRSFVPA